MIGSSRGPRRALALVLAWGATVLGLLAVAVPATAQATNLQLAFTVTHIDMSGTKADDTLTLSGTVTNTGTGPAYGVHVVLWRSQDPIKDLSTLTQATTNPTSSWGSLLWAKSEHWVSITPSTTPFEPGASRDVTVHATLGELGFDTRGAAYAVGAQVLATADMSSNYQVVGEYRTVVSFAGKETIPVTSVVMLSATPTRLMNGVFRDDSLVADLTGRLGQLLQAASRPGMSWLIDPALLDEVRDLADGYQVGVGSKATAGTGMATASAWLAGFALLDHHRGGRTLYANPDVNGARVAGRPEVLTRAQEAADQLSDIADLPLVIVPHGGLLSQPTYSFLADSGAAAILAANPLQLGALQSGTDEPLVLAGSILGGGGEDPAGQIDARQLAIATAVISGKSGVARLITDGVGVAQDQQAFTSAMQHRSLTELLTSTPSVQAQFDPTSKPARLSKSQFADVDRLAHDFETLTELSPDSGVDQQAAGALSRAVSSGFIGDEAAFRTQLGGLADLVSTPAIGRQVVLDASPRFLMSARSNQFPVTVTNELTEAIRVKVVVTTDYPQRLTVPASDVVSVDPGQSVTVNIRPEASANGVVTARAHVATEGGTRVTPDTAIIVEVTDLGVVAWIIVGTSAVVLVAATAWRIRQVRRRGDSVPADGKDA